MTWILRGINAPLPFPMAPKVMDALLIAYLTYCSAYDNYMLNCIGFCCMQGLDNRI